MQNFFVRTSDNVKIALNLYNSGHKSVIIICPGWFMTKDSKSFSDLAKKISNWHDVISMDFRGHGKSGGLYTFTEKEVEDLKAVVNFARSRYEKVYLMGFSLGGALVILHGALVGDVDKIIAVSAPSDFDKIENKMWHPNAWIPTFKKFEPRRWVSVRPSPVIGKKIKPIDVVDKISVPTLFIAGEKDVTVYPWHTELLFEKSVCEKKYELFTDCIHAEDIFMKEPERFINVCLDWLK